MPVANMEKKNISNNYKTQTMALLTRSGKSIFRLFFNENNFIFCRNSAPISKNINLFAVKKSSKCNFFDSVNSALPILYSFRRCPYAMRARMVLHYSKISYSLREVDLKNKPSSLLNLSPKGTVPVLVLHENKIIDESLDIMKYALSKHDPENIQPHVQQQKINELIADNDLHFVNLLKKYKYPQRYEGVNTREIRNKIEEDFLSKYELMLQKTNYLLGSKTIADYALLPFIRQFAYVDKEWFFNSKYSKLIDWLLSFIETETFDKIIMQKYEVWQD
ncbi:MAG TPA: glutathione S-transferase N-terminal domain-containing protein [Candidatus Megaira endosymbiont of Nemacystus decipiens]|nr:glutathione S-transferase N-terminal domain-containing protein [Candidatus Megaera endosymbiont of Nemacystus decipiens]